MTVQACMLCLEFKFEMLVCRVSQLRATAQTVQGHCECGQIVGLARVCDYIVKGEEPSPVTGDEGRGLDDRGLVIVSNVCGEHFFGGSTMLSFPGIS